MEQDEEIHRAPLMEDLQEEVAVEQPAPDRRREAIAELGDILDEGHLGQPVLQLIDQGEEEELPEPDFEPLGGREGDNLPSILDRQQLQAIREDLEKLLPRRHFATPAAAKAALLRLNITLIEQQSLFSWTTAISGILGEASCVATFAAGFFKDSMPMMATAGIGGLLVGGVTTAVLGLGLINLARQVRIESYRLS
ncbi:MAG TPA: hypothetical protein VJK48_01590 [Chlamydiales bacterium]|nr:hypothetical protein [Chlamydiales bacterium]